MRIVLSRKGLDSGSGGGPSPIVGRAAAEGDHGRPVSLPIPCRSGTSRTTYGALGLGDHVSRASRGRFGPDDPCHDDPMFTPDGRCLLGQCGAAQTHLERQGVGPGDVFVFFGLFADEAGRDRHHRIFGYLVVEQQVRLAEGVPAELVALHHPHALHAGPANDTVWSGEGRTASRASDALRLSVPGGPPTIWNRPGWLRPGGLSYHDRAERWLPGGRLRSASRGQEFVADIGNRAGPRKWLAQIVAAIRAS